MNSSVARLVTLDLATNTGFALVELPDLRILESGVVRLRDAGTAADAVNRLFELLERLKPEVVAAEAQGLGMARSTHVARLTFGLSVAAEWWCAVNDVQWLPPVNVNTIKKHASTMLGFERMKRDKSHTIEWATVLLGRKPRTDDEADAVCIASLAATEWKVVGA